MIVFELTIFLNSSYIGCFLIDPNSLLILFSEDTFTYCYLFDINMESKKCVMTCEPINASRPYCELYSVYLEEIQYYIGPYQIVDGQSLGKPYKQVLKRLQKIEERLLKMSY